MQDSPSPSVAAEAVTPPAKNTTMEDYRRKIDAQLLQAIESAEGDAAATTSPVLSMVPVNADGTVDISIRAAVTKDLVQQIEATGAQVTYTSAALNTINARTPLNTISEIAKLPPVVFVVPKPQATTRTAQPSPSAPAAP